MEGHIILYYIHMYVWIEKYKNQRTNNLKILSVYIKGDLFLKL